MGSYSYGPLLKFSQYTLLTRKEAPIFEAVLLFGSVEKSVFLALGVVAEEMVSTLYHCSDEFNSILSLPCFKIPSVALPYVLDKV